MIFPGLGGPPGPFGPFAAYIWYAQVRARHPPGGRAADRGVAHERQPAEHPAARVIRLSFVANRAIDWARARAARRESTGEPAEPVSPSPPAPGVYSEEVLAALASLSPEHRAVVVMRYVLEYTPGEIARALELPRGTINSRLRRGLDALETRLREAELR